MIRRILLTWGVVGRAFGMWLAPFGTLLLFGLLRLVVGLGMLLDNLLFPRLWRTRVEAPVVIVGNPRSGTTFLHRWMAANGFGAGTELWRALYPSLTVQLLLRPLLPLLERVSPARHHGSAAHKTSLRSEETDDVAVFFRYLDGLFLYSFLLAFDEKDHRGFVDPRVRDTSGRDFDWLEAVWRRNLVATGAGRQLPKLFTLSVRLPAFLERFPGARVLYLVRDPVSVIPSTMSLVTGPLEARFGFSKLPRELRSRYLDRLYRGMVELYRGFHQDWVSGRIPREKVMIVPYQRLMDDFEGLVDEMLAFLGTRATEDLRREIRRTAEAQRGRVSAHHYDLATFGLDAGRIRRDCAFVYETFLGGRQAGSAEA